MDCKLFYLIFQKSFKNTLIYITPFEKLVEFENMMLTDKSDEFYHFHSHVMSFKHFVNLKIYMLLYFWEYKTYSMHRMQNEFLWQFKDPRHLLSIWGIGEYVKLSALTKATQN